MTKKFIELTDEDLDALGAHSLRDAYKLLRAHHIEETTSLIGKLATARELLLDAGLALREASSCCPHAHHNHQRSVIIDRILSETRTKKSDPPR